MTILVTGATGQVGSAVARALVEAGVPVRTLVRDVSRAGGLGDAEVVHGSFEDGASLMRALDSVETLFLAGRDGPDTVALQRNVLQHAEQSGVSYVVKLSAIGAKDNSPIGLMRDHHTVDKILQASRLGWTLLQPHLYMQNLLRSADSVQQNARLSAPMADKRFPLVDTRDIGAAAAVVLRNPSSHINKAYQLTGPETYSYSEVARELSSVVCRSVTYDPVSSENVQSNLIKAGLPIGVPSIWPTLRPPTHLPTAMYRLTLRHWLAGNLHLFIHFSKIIKTSLPADVSIVTSEFYGVFGYAQQCAAADRQPATRLAAG